MKRAFILEVYTEGYVAARARATRSRFWSSVKSVDSNINDCLQVYDDITVADSLWVILFARLNRIVASWPVSRHIARPPPVFLDLDDCFVASVLQAASSRVADLLRRTRERAIRARALAARPGPPGPQLGKPGFAGRRVPTSGTGPTA